MSDLRQGREYVIWMKTIGWQVDKGAFIKKILGFRFIKIQRQKEFPSRLPGMSLVKLEPAWEDKTDYLKLGFKVDKTPMLPTKTVWLDLKKSEKQLLKEMHYKTRYNLKKYSGKVMIIRGDRISDKQLDDFFQIYQLNCNKQKFWGLSFNQLKGLIKAFDNKAWLLITNGAGLIILIHDQVSYYSHNGSDLEGRKNMAPTLLAWEAIKLAKKIGCTKFDFEGISDKRYKITQRWRGFTRFKKSFGGSEVEYRRPVKKLFLKESLWPR